MDSDGTIYQMKMKAYQKITISKFVIETESKPYLPIPCSPDPTTNSETIMNSDFHEFFIQSDEQQYLKNQQTISRS